MDYGSDLLLARGSREGGPETCQSFECVSACGVGLVSCRGFVLK